jgi:hypothetical protein
MGFGRRSFNVVAAALVDLVRSAGFTDDAARILEQHHGEDE